ncbi:hypothetical protein LCGC14_3076700 [marine sediment metagenome]|uniref:Uncharacterized protein n=1 Tax=marine sediment metagenome TaxID=412755 RepID=A0A0F8Z557_9ZZZZ
MLHRLINWLRGIDPLEEETWRIIRLKGTMPLREWLELAEAHYTLLTKRLEREKNQIQVLLGSMSDGQW